MNLLAFDTALGRGSVAVVVDGRVAAQRIEHEPRALAERLVPMIEETLEAAGESYQSMDRLAVTVGPGTFTGTRIGVATARGLGLATGLPVIGISTLEALAAAVDAVDVGASIAAAIDARRGQVYLQIFLRTADGIEPVREPAAVDLDGIGDVVSGHDGGRRRARRGDRGAGIGGPSAGNSRLRQNIARCGRPSCRGTRRAHRAGSPALSAQAGCQASRWAGCRVMTCAIEIMEVDQSASDLLARLHAGSFCRPGDETWSAKSFSDVLAMAGSFCLIAQVAGEAGSEPIGFAASRIAGDDSELLTIGVLPRFRKAGTARELIAKSLDRCRAAGVRRLVLEVAEDNPTAQELYRSLGFEVIGRRPAYYRRLHGRRVAAITMRLRVPPL